MRLSISIIALCSGVGYSRAQVYYNSSAYENGDYGITPAQTFVSRPDLRPPALNILTSQTDTSLYSEGYWLLTINGFEPPQYGPMVFDYSGNLVYSAGNFSSLDFVAQTLNDEPVLTYYVGPIGSVGVGSGLYIVENSSYEKVREVQVQGYPANTTDFHEMLITNNNTFLVQTWVIVEADLSSQGGPVDGFTFDCVVQELDENNNVLFNWSSLAHVPVSDSYFSLSGTGANISDPYDYCHSNSQVISMWKTTTHRHRIEKDDDGTYLISLRGPSALYKVDPSGELIWTLSGKNSSFQMGDNSTFWYQHDARWLNDSSVNPRYLSLFDNAGAANVPAEPEARGIILSVDTTNMTVDLVAEYLAPTNLISGSQGSMSVSNFSAKMSILRWQLLDNQNIAVGWGSQSRFTEFAQDGTILFDAEFSVCSTPQCTINSYRALKQVWFGSPTSQPDVGFNSSQIFVSWNGATNVTDWALLTGNSTNGLSHAKTFSRIGFESNSTFPTNSVYLGVAGFDANGQCLGVSDLYYSANTTTSGQTVSCSAISD